jgi:hypothetical protein
MGQYPGVSHTGVVTRVLGREWSPRDQLISLVHTPDPTVPPTGGRQYLYLDSSSPKLWPPYCKPVRLIERAPSNTIVVLSTFSPARHFLFGIVGCHFLFGSPPTHI